MGPEKIVAYQQQHDVRYEGIEHPPAASALDYQKTLGTELQQQAKSLFVRFKRHGERGFAIVTVQAQKQVDLDRIRELLDATSVKLADKQQLHTHTGCQFGELPPLGKPFDVQLLMDRDLLAQDKVYFNAGRLDYSMAVDPKEIQRLEAPILF
ncbi:YbaK/EbsC family protein [Candidatus Entotheonella palauensis]|uniref:YbaK/EbsC family protein n=1 Tax=Candidatus Entotheonella palauensis TaxID=93172 RepID=UPI000B7FA273|nr:YbaK/EbsC family protein [Candidatus Entotheonella palauensis]